MVLMEQLLLPVPNGLATERAALTEPMAVGFHAVEMARLTSEDVPLVIGCGPIGLAVISALKTRDVRPIIAAVPYALTVVLLAGFIGKSVAPAALGRPYVKER